MNDSHVLFYFLVVEDSIRVVGNVMTLIAPSCKWAKILFNKVIMVEPIYLEGQ